MFAPELGTQAFSGYRAFALKANSQNGGAIVQYRKSWKMKNCTQKTEIS